MKRATADLINAPAEDTAELETTLQAGQVLDRKYRVDYLVGQGGMAAVWAGTNERTGKRVALKVLLRSFSTIPGGESLLQREVLAASRVDHPNVVTVFDVIEHHRMACIVMELLAGETLDRRFARIGRLSMSEANALLLPAMRGVSAAHAQGVVHSDLKPQNIFICVGPDGRPVTTKVLDFGISRIAGRSREPLAGQSSDMVMGTPAYMAPEQFTASAPIDRRTDVYGFGVILYEVLAGQLPFPGKAGDDLYRRILTEPAPPLAQFRPDLPPTFVRIIDTALAKDPALRQPCLDAMIGALEDELLPDTPPPVSVNRSGDTTIWARGGPGQTELPSMSAEERRPTKLLLSFGRKDHSGQRDSGPSDQNSDAFARDDQTLKGRVLRLVGVVRDALSTSKNPAHARAWQGLAGLGIAVLVAGIVFMTWSSRSSGSKPSGSLPTLQAASPPSAVPSPGDPVVATGAPPPQLEGPVLQPVVPGAGDGVAEPAAPAPLAGSAAAHDSKSATPEGRKDTPVRRTALRVTSQGKAADPAPSQPGPAGGATSARAGSLSPEDF